ncbi:hypothetical protein [Bradyrhizobium sp. B117]|uniref:hypothetical protein n=1 Tax=Bradyrhizobium sp. B117 TaxID=3140246 RepID=UPI00318325B3
MQAADFSATLQNLFAKGVRYGTVVDLGCADGHFGLNHLSCLGGAMPFNIDANGIYEDSLRAIKEALGGDYRICAITDHEGEIQITEWVATSDFARSGCARRAGAVLRHTRP